jgi:hypothetical protein
LETTNTPFALSRNAGGVRFYGGGPYTFASSDCVHWPQLSQDPAITLTDFGFDSQNVPFWSPVENLFVRYFRFSGRQIVARCGEILGGCSFGRARTAATSTIFKALRRE